MTYQEDQHQQGWRDLEEQFLAKVAGGSLRTPFLTNAQRAATKAAESVKNKNNGTYIPPSDPAVLKSLGVTHIPKRTSVTRNPQGRILIHTQPKLVE
jgi:hypothetical protein